MTDNNSTMRKLISIVSETAEPVRESTEAHVRNVLKPVLDDLYATAEEWDERERRENIREQAAAQIKPFFDNAYELARQVDQGRAEARREIDPFFNTTNAIAKQIDEQIARREGEHRDK